MQFRLYFKVIGLIQLMVAEVVKGRKLTPKTRSCLLQLQKTMANPGVDRGAWMDGFRLACEALRKLRLEHFPEIDVDDWPAVLDHYFQVTGRVDRSVPADNAVCRLVLHTCGAALYIMDLDSSDPDAVTRAEIGWGAHAVAAAGWLCGILDPKLDTASNMAARITQVIMPVATFDKPAEEYSPAELKDTLRVFGTLIAILEMFSPSKESRTALFRSVAPWIFRESIGLMTDSLLLLEGMQDDARLRERAMKRQILAEILRLLDDRLLGVKLEEEDRFS